MTSSGWFGQLALVAVHLATLVAWSALAFAFGKRACARLRFVDPAEELGVCLGVGLGLSALALFGLGVVGRLNSLWLAAGIASAAILFRRAFPEFARCLRELAAGWKHRRRAGMLWAGLFAIAFALALYPPLGFDETAYHLPFARAFVHAGGLVWTPDLTPEIFPQLLEVLFAAAMLIGGDANTHVVCMLVTAAAAAALAGAGARLGVPYAGWFAMACFLGHPLVWYQLSSAYVDVGVSAFAIGATATHMAWRDERSPAWLIASGLLAGFAAGTKYHGLFFVVALALASVTARAKPAARVLSTLLFLGAAGLAMAPWYGRIVWRTGDPIYGLLAPGRPGLGSENSLIELLPAPLVASGREWLRSPGAAATRLLAVSFDREAVQRQAPLSPTLTVVMALALWAAIRDRRLRLWILVGFAYLLPLYFLDIRYWLPGLGLLSVAAGAGLAHLAAGSRGRARLAWGMALLIGVTGPLYGLVRLRKLGWPVVVAGERVQFFERTVPGFRCLAVVNRQPGQGAVYALRGLYLTYYTDRRLVHEFTGPPWTYSQLPLTDGSALSEYLRRHDVEFFLVSHRFGVVELPTDAEFLARFQPLVATPDCSAFRLRSGR